MDIRERKTVSEHTGIETVSCQADPHIPDDREEARFYCTLHDGRRGSSSSSEEVYVDGIGVDADRSGIPIDEGPVKFSATDYEDPMECEVTSNRLGGHRHLDCE